MNWHGPAGIPTAGCICDRCEYLRATSSSGPEHIGVHIMDVIDVSNAGCRCTRCEWLRAKNIGAVPTAEIKDDSTICCLCGQRIPNCTCGRPKAS